MSVMSSRDGLQPNFAASYDRIAGAASSFPLRAYAVQGPTVADTQAEPPSLHLSQTPSVMQIEKQNDLLKS
jgi:hypothetical protein